MSLPCHPDRNCPTQPSSDVRSTALLLVVASCMALLDLGSTAALAYSVPPQNVQITMVDPDPSDGDPSVQLSVTFSDVNGETDYSVQEFITDVGGTTDTTTTLAAVPGVASTVLVTEFLALPNTEYCYLISANYSGAVPGHAPLTCAVTPAEESTTLWRAEVEMTLAGAGANKPVDVRLRYGGAPQGPQGGGLTHVFVSENHLDANATGHYDLMLDDVGTTDDITQLLVVSLEDTICISELKLRLNEETVFERFFPSLECVGPGHSLRISAMDLRSTTEWVDFASTGLGPEELVFQAILFSDVERILDAYLGHQLAEANLAYGSDFLSWVVPTTVSQIDKWTGRVDLGIRVSGAGSHADFEASFKVRPSWVCDGDLSKLQLELSVSSFNADFGLLIDIILGVIPGVGSDDVEDFLLGLLCDAWTSEVPGEYILLEFEADANTPSACSLNSNVNFGSLSLALFGGEPRPLGPGACECGSPRLEEECTIQFRGCNPGFFAQCNELYPDSPDCGGCTCLPEPELCPTASLPDPEPEPSQTCGCGDSGLGNVCTSSFDDCGPGMSPVCTPSLSWEEPCGGCECVETQSGDPDPPPPPTDTCGCSNSGLGNVCISGYDDCAEGKHPVCSPILGDPEWDEDGIHCGGCICAQ